MLHKLVLNIFVGPRPPGMVCCHANDDLLDNCLSTCAGNAVPKQCRQPPQPPPARPCQKNAKLTIEKVRLIRALARLGHPQKVIAELTGVCVTTISNVECGVSWGWVKD